MSVTPAEFLALAETLGQAAQDEAAHRSAISRAYYGVFHAASAFHVALPTPGNLTQRPGGVHEDLVQRLLNPGVAKNDPKHMVSRQVGVLTRGLRDARVQADYAIQKSVDQAATDNALALARKTMALL